MTRIWLISFILIVCLATGCSPPSQTSTPAGGTQSPVHLFAASSTTDACELLIAQFKADHPAQIKGNYASSGTLSKQILNGAPASIFLSANQEWADSVSEAGLSDRRLDLLANRVVVIVPKQSTVKLTQPDDLKSAAIQRIAIGDWESVPAGIYGKEVLHNLGLWDELERKLVPQANVRQALALVELQETDAGIVYLTDAKISDQVEVAFVFKESTHRPIYYPLLLLKSDIHHPPAEAFFDYLCSPASRTVFEKMGFEFLPDKPAP